MQIVYFIQGKLTGLIRIGSSASVANVFVRFRDLQTANCDELELLAVGRPLDIKNNIFQKVHGDWYLPTNELLAYIEVIKQRPVDTPINRNYDVRGKVWSKFGYVSEKKEILRTPQKPMKRVSLIRPYKEVTFRTDEELKNGTS